MSNEALHEAIRAAEEKKSPGKITKNQNSVPFIPYDVIILPTQKPKPIPLTNIRTGATAEPKTKKPHKKARIKKMSDGVKIDENRPVKPESRLDSIKTEKVSSRYPSSKTPTEEKKAPKMHPAKNTKQKADVTGFFLTKCITGLKKSDLKRITAERLCIITSP